MGSEGLKQPQQIMPINTLVTVDFPEYQRLFLAILDGMLIKVVKMTQVVPGPGEE
jgi:hypothetical protein